MSPSPSLSKGLKAPQEVVQGLGEPRWGEDHALTSRSVYLHNNKLADAGLPDSMFNGSSSVEVLILSSNFLRHVPKHLPPALYKLHLKVGRERDRRGSSRSMARAEGTEPWWGGRQKPGHLTFGVAVHGAVSPPPVLHSDSCPGGSPDSCPFRDSALALTFLTSLFPPPEQQAGEDPTWGLQ